MNSGKSFLLLLLFLFSCTLQVTLTLKYARLTCNSNGLKASKNIVNELPDTPENPEKNNCEYFEEDSNDESVKDFNFADCFILSEIANINFEKLIIDKHYINHMDNHVVENIYLSFCTLKI